MQLTNVSKQNTFGQADYIKSTLNRTVNCSPIFRKIFYKFRNTFVQIC